jgi:hypothetical protein
MADVLNRTAETLIARQATTDRPRQTERDARDRARRGRHHS